MFESLLHEAACRQRPEIRVKVCYIKVCVDRELNYG